MFVDMHMHEMTYSKDSFLALDEIVSIAKQKGLDAVCITDHDDMGLKDFAKEYTERTGFPVFVGIEFYSLQGDILAFGIDKYPDHRIDAQEFVDMVHAQGGITISAHPFRSNRRGLEGQLDIVKGIDAIEVLNGSTLPVATLIAAQYANKLNLATTGGSDCHVPEKVGCRCTYFPKEIRTMEELIEAVKNHECKPAYYQNGAYHVWDITGIEPDMPPSVETATLIESIQ